MAYTIDAVARLTGISAFTLRNWEKRYDFLKPKRLGNGFRTYDDRHVELLRKVATLLSHGARIGDLAECIRKGKPLPEIASHELAPEIAEQVDALFSALLAFDLDRAESVHSRLAGGFSDAELLDLVYSPLLTRIGLEMTSGAHGRPPAHFASTFVRMRLAGFLATPDKAPNPRKKVVCATTERETEDGTILLLSSHLKLSGWGVYFLGTGLPVEDIRAAAEAVKPALVCLDFSDQHGIRAALRSLAQFDCTVCIGGFGALTFDSEEELPRHLRLSKSGGRAAAQHAESLLV